MSRRNLTKEPVLDVLNKHLFNASAFERCSFGYWLDKQDDATKEGFKKIFDSKNISAQQLYTDLIDAGTELPCKLTTFRSHMKGYCLCQKN